MDVSPRNSYNKYTQIASRAVRTGLKESERVGAEKRANIGIKYQQWNAGKGGEQVSVEIDLVCLRVISSGRVGPQEGTMAEAEQVKMALSPEGDGCDKRGLCPDEIGRKVNK